MNPIRPATPRAIDNPTGKTRARHDAMPNRAHPSANSTTVTSHALTRELPVRSALNISGVTRAIHGQELADVGDGEQATGNHSDRPGMGTERRLGHENLP